MALANIENEEKFVTNLSTNNYMEQKNEERDVIYNTLLGLVIPVRQIDPAIAIFHG